MRGEITGLAYAMPLAPAHRIGLLEAALVAAKGAQLILIVENIFALAMSERHRAVASDAAWLTRGLRPLDIFG